MGNQVLAPVTVDLTKNPPAPHKKGIAWEHQQKYGYLRKRIACGIGHTVAVLPNGTAVGCGANGRLQLDLIETWTDLVEIDCGQGSTFGLKSDGKLKITGAFWPSELSPDNLEELFSQVKGTAPRNWIKKVVSISCTFHRDFHMVGLTEDGYVYAFGYDNTYGQCDVDGWCDIIQAVAVLNMSIGVRRDGTVVVCGDCDAVSQIACWTNIEHIYTNKSSTIVVGLKYDGTVVCSNASFDTSHWKNIIHIAVCNQGIAGLDGNGKVFFAGNIPQNMSFANYGQVLDIHIDNLENFFAISSDIVYMCPIRSGELMQVSAQVAIATSGSFQTMLVIRNGDVQVLLDDKFNAGQDQTDAWNLLTMDSATSNVQTQDNGNSSGGCYIATAVYGSYNCPEVWTLRRFRDNILAKTWYGRLFIKTYYAISPTLVKWFGKTTWFQKLWKPRLDRMVTKLQCNGVESTPYQDKNW